MVCTLFEKNCFIKVCEGIHSIMLLATIRNCSPRVRKWFYYVVVAYYFLVRLIFNIWNSFKPKVSIGPPGDPLLFFSATKAASLIMQKQLKAVDLLESYIKRIEEVNPVINAMSFKNFEEARENAKNLDEMMANFSVEERTIYCRTRPLIGVPFTVKDSFLIAGKVTTSGVSARKDYVAEETAEVIKRVEDAGAILVGLTTTSEYCMWIETSTTLFGTTNNPFDLRRTVGGCSGGEAAIIGAGASLFGIASDYAASLRQPAFFNCVFGMMPSPGKVPNHGHFPKIDSPNSYKPIFGRVGYICRYSEDLPLILEVISGSKLPANLPEPVRLFYSRGISESLIIEPTSKGCQSSLFQALSFIEEEYDTTAEKMCFPQARWIFELVFASFRQHIYEPVMADLLNDSWFRLEEAEQTNCAEELVKYVRRKSDHSLAAILYGLTDESTTFTAEERDKYVKERDVMKEALIESLSPNGLLFFPSFPTRATFHGELLLKRTNMVHTVLANVLGVPAIQCPMGVDAEGIPQGVMIIGAAGSERLLIDTATRIAKEFGGWVPPGMTGTL